MSALGSDPLALYAPEDQKAPLRAHPAAAAWNLTQPQIHDLELLLSGAFSPLRGFLGPTDYAAVLEKSCLADGTVWPLPITLDVSEVFAESVKEGDTIALHDAEGLLVAVMRVDSQWRPDKNQEAEAVFGTTDPAHPGVYTLLEQRHPMYLGGEVTGVDSPVHYDFRHFRATPAQVRERLKSRGWEKTLALTTGHPLHRADEAMARRAIQQHETNLMLFPRAYMHQPGDMAYYAQIRCYEQVLDYFPRSTTDLVLLPLFTRHAGPREAVLQAIISRNYGFSHVLIPARFADPGNGERMWYGPNAAFEQVDALREALGITPVSQPPMVYAEARAQFVAENDAVPGAKNTPLSAGEFYRRLEEGLDVPEWFTFPEVLVELRKAYPPRDRQGFTVFFTGLSGSGKSTIANALMVKLLETGSRQVTLLDGDLVRKHLSSELGFSKEHRDLNIRRIGYVASEITKNGGIAICAPIAPYTATRRAVRDMIDPLGGFIEIHVSTPLSTCEDRDRKGLYAKARAGLIKGFTGIDDPYETPETPELSIDTTHCTPDEAVQRILLKLESLGYW